MTNIQEWQAQLTTILNDLEKQASFKAGDLLVIGCSTSEVIGEKIGTAGTVEVAQMIFEALKTLQEKTKIDLAFQCCEHLNRALVIEREVARKHVLEEVSVIPVRKAGGAMGTYAYQHAKDPVIVEKVGADAGIDIGDTFIGMHLKPVAVPIRSSIKELGYAHVTMAKTRPKLIGGSRAVYEVNDENESCS